MAEKVHPVKKQMTGDPSLLKTEYSKDQKLIRVVLVCCITIIGAIPRMYFAILSKYPLHDGGLFYAMIQDLQRAGYALPTYTSYNAANIPFAYPPLGFYLAGILASLGHWSLMDVMRLLPPIISVLTIPAFYRFSRLFLDDEVLSIFACLGFATIPPAYNWFVMGGGLTRSLGLFFALLSVYALYVVIQLPEKRHVLTAGICVGLTMLSHPAAIWFVTYSAIFLFIISKRHFDSLIRVALAGLAAAVLTMPWWLVVLSRQGITPFFSAGGNAFDPLSSFLSLVFLQFTIEPLMKIWAVIGLLGFLICLQNRRMGLPAWLFVIALFQGRGWQNYIQVPFTMLIGIGLQQVLSMLGQNNSKMAPQSNLGPGQKLDIILGGMAPKIGLVYILVVSIISAFMAAPQTGLSQAEVDAMEWVANHTPADSTFALVSGDASDDIVSEWFPAVAGRSSLATAQGSEWKGKIFDQLVSNHSALQLCSTQNSECLEQWSHSTGNTLRYIYVVVTPTTSYSTESLLSSLGSSANFTQIYSSPEVRIFERSTKSDAIDQNLRLDTNPTKHLHERRQDHDRRQNRI
jgi:hypothetical protein